MLEIKGRPYEDTDAKHQAANRWVSAVNNWGTLGQWDFLVCREPQKLAEGFATLLEHRKKRIASLAEELRMQAESEVTRLRALGWTPDDFANALAELLESQEGR